LAFPVSSKIVQPAGLLGHKRTKPAAGTKWMRRRNRLNRACPIPVRTETRAIAAAPGPVVLVGHPWGGAVITQAGDDPKVKALVYVAAFAPPVGMSVNDMGKGAPPSPGSREVVLLHCERARRLSMLLTEPCEPWPVQIVVSLRREAARNVQLTWGTCPSTVVGSASVHFVLRSETTRTTHGSVA